jgi:uncharacterized membrane protein
MQVLAGKSNMLALSQMKRNTFNIKVIHVTTLFASFFFFLWFPYPSAKNIAPYCSTLMRDSAMKYYALLFTDNTKLLETAVLP